MAKVVGKKLPVSPVRVKKFCPITPRLRGTGATTKFDAQKAHSTGFEVPYSIDEGLDRTLKYEFGD